MKKVHLVWAQRPGPASQPKAAAAEAAAMAEEVAAVLAVQPLHLASVSAAAVQRPRPGRL